MLFGKRRGTLLALALALTLGLGLVMARSTWADGFASAHTIPRVVDAYDFRTGGPYMAPPIPYGHYAKDYLGAAHGHLGCASCKLHGLMGCGGHGHCLFHKGGCGHGGACGNGDGAGLGGTASGGHGLFGHQGGSYPATGAVYDPASGGSVYDPAAAGSAGYATTWAQSSGQAMIDPSGQSICGQPSCTITGKHSHLSQMLNKIRCGSCGGAGCGLCGGTGATGLCGDPGCSQGAGHQHGGGTGCWLCKGKGCKHCLGGGGHHGGKLASLAGALHTPRVSWFNGPGGPVPLTPGYVPYIVTTRSPRDFFSFPPMNPDAR